MTTDFARLAHPPEPALVALAEHHRTALKAACAEDSAIWPIYSVSFDPDHFDAQFDRILADPNHIAFAIKDDDAVCGMTAYLNLKPAFETVEIGNTYLRPAVRGTGLNRRIKDAMIGHAFACGIRRIEFRIDDRNARSKAAVRKLSAMQDGLIRAERVTWTGHVRDTALFSILAGEWA
ncbi:GNAT family N-acetyltransferase [Sphingomonas nostoxanthinifaciens]|uniref:GNAT family N-acetyltransferase n=1 Tax=Sphingomonas nostoxanthinifaciens TaxID=2872652 RepID=UPI001CC1F57B|nr:GNAT family protein [Sphingomonas nostoxanthinifaciens]UAK25989.1 GNAT family N-acetyltransferase [Sphingomonas nostoxanthinifaciens]